MKKSAAILLSIILIISASVPSTAAMESDVSERTVDASSADASEAATPTATSETGTPAATSETGTSSAPDSAETGAAKSDNSTAGGTKYIEDDMTGIRTEISSETLDDDAYTFLRGYFNDNTLTEDQLFNRFFDLKKSYIRSLESLYNVNYLSNSSRKSETALHIYYEGSDTLFGIEGCGVYLYNISVYEGLKHREESHLDLIIPVRGTNTIEMIRFTIPKENLGILASSYVAYVLSENRVKGAAPQYRAPAILYSESLTEDAKHGIYPAESQTDPTYVRFEDTAAGYGIHIPYSYVPFVKNNLGGDYSYNSYKINPNLIFSISSEPIEGNGAEDAISRFRVTSLTSIEILKNGYAYYGNNLFNYIYYTNVENGMKKYYFDYYIQNDKKLYKLQLTSAYAEPDKNVTGQLEKILTGFDYKLPTAAGSYSVSVEDVTMGKYLNSEEGYSFEYPESWSLRDVSNDISYDRLRLVVPGMSGAIDVTFQESGIIDSASFTDIIKSVEGNSISSWPNITIGYRAPFAGRTSKLLFSDFSIDGPISTIYRLSAFIDENGRNRLCYSIDILKGKKIYSMFITSAEYMTENGYFQDAELNGLLDKVAASFGLEDTAEAQARAASGETRNRRLILAENYLKEKIDLRLKITSVGKIQSDNTMFLTAGNTKEDDGYYKIRLAYEKGHVELLDRVLKQSILNSEADHLEQQYADKKIISVTTDKTNMLITIKYEDRNFAVELSHIYLVRVSQDNGRLSWDTRRVANQEDYIRECSLYVKSMFALDTNVYVYGNNVFKDLDIYRQENLTYRVFTYEQNASGSGFLLMSMNPVTSIFKPEGNYIPMKYVIGKIEEKYGITADTASDAYEFDTDNFILTLSVSVGPDGKSGTERFSVYYDMDNGVIDYVPVE